MKKLLLKIIAWWKHRRWLAKHEKVLDQYGWDGQCHECGLWHHTDNAGTFLKDTFHHWHYGCKCGTISHYHLYAPCPIKDQVEGKIAYEQDAACEKFKYCRSDAKISL